MKFLTALLFCLLCSPITLSQSKPFLKDSGTFGFSAETESITFEKFLEDKNQLLLIGRDNLQLIDLTTRKVIETRAITLPSRRPRFDYKSTWKISPDGRRMLIVGHPDARVGGKHTAWIWDLETANLRELFTTSTTNQS